MVIIIIEKAPEMQGVNFIMVDVYGRMELLSSYRMRLHYQNMLIPNEKFTKVI
jgi:hypothetical protein